MRGTWKMTMQSLGRFSLFLSALVVLELLLPAPMKPSTLLMGQTLPNKHATLDDLLRDRMAAMEIERQRELLGAYRRESFVIVPPPAP